jgi:flagellar basal-body rod protein FlgF
MENALLVGLSRQVALARELDVLANNVANMDTNGFKRRSTIFQEFVSGTARADSFKSADKPVSFVWDKGTALQFTQGTVERTGNPLDVAVRGDALFSVTAPGGERYTRNGSFEINAKGQLVTSDGFPLVSDQGPVNFTAQDTDIRIAPDGTITTAQGNKGKLKLVTFADPQTLRNEGRNLFSSTKPGQPAGKDSMVEQGAVEKSNVRSVIEMTRLIEINRTYQNIATMMQRTDELRSKAIMRLADQQA